MSNDFILQEPPTKRRLLYHIPRTGLLNGKILKATTLPFLKNIITRVGKIARLIVIGVFWAKHLCSLALRDTCFRMNITLGAVLIRSLVCAKCIPGYLRSGSGLALD